MVHSENEDLCRQASLLHSEIDWDESSVIIDDLLQQIFTSLLIRGLWVEATLTTEPTHLLKEKILNKLGFFSDLFQYEVQKE